MKKIALIAALGMGLFTGFRSDARVNINVQIGVPVAQQSWYAGDNDYIFMPDQGVYYNTRRQVYVFQDGGRWCTAQRLPARFGNVSYMSARGVRMQGARPFDRGFDNRNGFAMQNGSFRGADNQFNNRGQQAAGDRSDGRGFNDRDTRGNGFSRGRH